MNNWIDIGIQSIYYLESALLIAVVFPYIYFKMNILLENEYPTTIDFDDLILKSQDEEGNRTYLIEDDSDFDP